MEIEPHDILEMNPKAIVSHSPIPDWAIQSLSIAPYVVVRRAHAPNGQVAIGIRGKARNERFAACLPEDDVIRQIKPEDLTSRHLRKNKQLPVFFSLEMAGKILEKCELVWGPGGSVGFELASGVETATYESDLDLIIRAPNPISIDFANQIINGLNGCPARVDAIVETAAGAFSLMEYAKSHSPILLKTKYGPVLSENPWT